MRQLVFLSGLVLLLCDFIMASRVVAGEATDLKFLDVSGASGTAGGSKSKNAGAAMSDLDGDGDLDLFVTGMTNHKNALYRNDGGLRFASRSARNLEAVSRAGRSVALADFDGDGDADIFLANYNTANILYRNDGALRFQDVSEGITVAVGGVGIGVTTGDFDGDGLLDIVLVNQDSGNFLYRNSGGLKFENSILSAVPSSKGGDDIAVASADLDQDGDLDIYVATQDGSNKLFRNDGGLSFVEVASASKVADSSANDGYGVALADLDGDGNIDIYVANYGQPNKLFRNRGNFTFEDVSSISGADDTGKGNGVALADFDGDGLVDILVTNREQSNKLYRNLGNWSFVDISKNSGVDDPANGNAVVVGDLDGDGDLDLFLANRGQQNKLYRNELTSVNWLFVRPLDYAGHATLHGATVRLLAATGTLLGIRTINGGGGFDVEVRLSGAAVWITKYDLPALGGVSPRQTLVVELRCPRGRKCEPDDPLNFSRPCPAGEWSDPEPTFPLVGVPCEGNDCIGSAFYCPNGSASPLAVDPGYYSIPESSGIKARTGQLPCNETKNEFCGGGVKSKLPPGYYQDKSDSENEIRRICPAGYQCTNGNKLKCSPGSYCPKYSDAERPCPAGFFCVVPANRTSCVIGQYCPVGSVEPKACAAGSSGVNIEGFSECVDCAPGKNRSLGEGADVDNAYELVCARCPVGTVSAGEGAATCTECTGGIPGAGSIYCDECRAGTFLDTTSTSTTPSCTLCDAGFRCLQGVKEPCGATEYSLPGSSFCSNCTSGTFLNASRSPSTCDDCPSGSVSKAAAVECTPCEAGTWQSGADCVACAAGRFGNRSGLSDEECDGACPPGTHSYRYATKCQDCEAGKHAPSASMEDCVACDDAKDLTPSLDATRCLCDVDTYRDAYGECAPCVEGVDCSSVGNELATLELKRNHWRPGTRSDKILRCPFDDACLGSANATCAEGNEGVLCAVCSESHFRPSSLTKCASCPDSPSAAAITALVVILAMALGLVALVAINRRAPNGLLRPGIDMVQRFSVMMLFNAPFPDVLVRCGQILGGLSFGLDLVALECVGVADSFYGAFAATVGLLVVVCAALLLPLLHSKVSLGWTLAETVSSEAAGMAFRDVFVVVLMVHPSVSGKAMEFFRCREVDGVAYLVADYSLECYDARWWTFFPFVLFVLLAFSFGTPLAIYRVLRKRSTELYDADGTPNARALDVLYAIYKPAAYWYESVQMVLKLALWSTLVFFEYRSAMQLATALVVNVLQLCIHLVVMPMGGPDAAMLNAMQAAGLVLTTYINFGGISMNYLDLQIEVATLKQEDELVGGYRRSNGVILNVMNFLTFALFLTFVAVALKKAAVAARGTSLADVRTKVEASIPVCVRRLWCSADDAAISIASNPAGQGAGSVQLTLSTGGAAQPPSPQA